MHRFRRRHVLALVAAAPLAAWACGRSSPPLKEMTPAAVQAKLAAKDGATFVYDCNDEDMFKDGHVPGAKWIAHSAPAAGDLPSDKGATLIFYCANEL